MQIYNKIIEAKLLTDGKEKFMEQTRIRDIVAVEFNSFYNERRDDYDWSKFTRTSYLGVQKSSDLYTWDIFEIGEKGLNGLITKGKVVERMIINIEFK